MECKIVRVLCKLRLGNNVERISHGSFKALYQHLTGRTSNMKLGIVTKAKLSLSLSNHTMNMRSGGVDLKASPFLTLALKEMWSASCPSLFNGTHCKRGWAGPTASLDVMEKRNIFCPCWEPNPNSSVVQHLS
jgi:hypothetical protein